MKQGVWRKYTLSEVEKLKRKLDRLFHPMIRLRDQGKPCIDLCGKQGVMQAGHFRRRELRATRWDYRNVNAQTAYCNAWDNDTYRHAKGIDERWGNGTAKKLDDKSKKIKQWTGKELEQLIEATKNYDTYVEVYNTIKI